MLSAVNAVRSTGAVLLMVLCLASASPAAVIERAEYRPVVSLLPDTEVTEWTLEGGSGSTRAYLLPNALYMDTLQDITVGHGYKRTTAAQHSTDTLVIEAKAKVHEYNGQYYGPNAGSCAIFWADDATSNVLTIYPDRIQLYFPYNAGAFYVMNTTDAYHTYKIVANGPNNTVKVYVDGVLVIDTIIASGQGYNRSWLMFGDGSSGGGSLSSWEFFNYRVER